MASRRTNEGFSEQCCREGGKKDNDSWQGGNNDVLWWTVTTCFGIIFLFGIVSTLPLVTNDDREKFSSQDHVGIRSKFYFELIPSHHGAIYFWICDTVSRCLLLLVVKYRLYCTKEDGVVSVPVWIIINTNESIELDWTHTSSPMEGVDGVLYRIDLLR